MSASGHQRPKSPDSASGGLGSTAVGFTVECEYGSDGRIAVIRSDGADDAGGPFRPFARPGSIALGRP